VSAAPDLLDWVRGLVSVAFVLLLPLLIIGTSVRTVFTDREFILNGFRQNQVGATTGLDDAQLQRIADAFVAYFQAPPGQIQMQVTAFGQSRPLFNDREVAHMEDVQALVQFFLRMQLVAAAIVAIRLVVALTLEREPAALGRDMLFSVGLMLTAIVVVGAMALIDFDAFWTRFHQIAFRNGLWLLDPTRDYLIMLFPEPFWFAGTIRFVTLIGAQTLAVAVLGAGLLIVPRLLQPQARQN
jgi:integral membrane protein (TIGR01906 family)